MADNAILKKGLDLIIEKDHPNLYRFKKLWQILKYKNQCHDLAKISEVLVHNTGIDVEKLDFSCKYARQCWKTTWSCTKVPYGYTENISD